MAMNGLKVLSMELVSDDLGAPLVTLERVAQRGGPDRWAIRRSGAVLGRDLEFDYEPLPSSRNDVFYANYRYATQADALHVWVDHVAHLQQQAREDYRGCHLSGLRAPTVEIERKFRLRDDSWRNQVVRTSVIHQGYLSLDAARTVRVRTRGESAWLTVKGKAAGLARPEFEYPIPLEDAQQMLGLALASVDKLRHEVEFAGRVWEVDEFLGDNAGLVIAELELKDEAEQFAHPAWLGEEVSTVPAYFNSALASHPFSKWLGDPAKA